MIFTEYSYKTLAAKVDLLGEDDLLKRIFVPVDFSDCSDNAIRYAVAIAIRTGAEIFLFNSVQVPLQAAEMATYPLDALEKEAAHRIGNLAQEITTWLDKERFRKLKVHHQVAIGFAAEEIALKAKAMEADLVVMGTRGTGAIEGMILGSNASSVVQNVTCPVLVVPEDAEFHGFDRIAYASDMHEVNAKAIQTLVHFASHFHSEINVLHILTKADELSTEQANSFREQFKKVAKYGKVSFHIAYAEDKSVATMIEEFMDSNAVEIVAMVTHHRSFFDKLFHPSLTRRLTVHARKPLLAFH
ncbi:MAG: universal stress protein [Bacteroidetes bacterium]|nr:universal stress protein [Bacteroidota bacterium]